MSPEQAQQAAIQIATAVSASPIFSQSKSLAAYYPFDGEISPLPLLQLAHERGKTTWLPVITADSKILRFARYLPDKTPLKENALHLLEPVTDDISEIDNIDICCVPLVGFDGKGNRLGMGGGYYDRTFAVAERQPYRIGLAYACQQVPQIKTDRLDVGLDSIVTEQRVYVFS